MKSHFLLRGGNTNLRQSEAEIKPFVIPTHGEASTRHQNNEKLGFVANLGYRINPNSTLNLDWVGLRSNSLLHQDSISHHFNYNTEEQVSIDYSGTIGVLESGTFLPTASSIYSQAEKSDSSANNFTAEVDFDFLDVWHMQVKLQYLESNLQQDVGAIESSFSPYSFPQWVGDGTAAPFGFDMASSTGWLWSRVNTVDGENEREFIYRSGKRPYLQYRNSEWLQNPEYMGFVNNNASRYEASESLYSLRHDIQYQPDHNWFSYVKFGWRLEKNTARFNQFRYLTDYSLTEGAAHPNQYDTNGALIEPSNFDRLREPAEGDYNVGVREANYFDLCGNGGLLQGNICDIDGDGVDDNHPIWPYGYNTGYIGYIAAVNLQTSTGIPMPGVLYGEDMAEARIFNSPSFTTHYAYSDATDRVKQDGHFFPSGGYLQRVTLPDLHRVSDNVPAWIDSIAPNSPSFKFLAPLNSWTVEQQSQAFYVESNIESQHYPVDINWGLRSVRTELTVYENIIDPDKKSWRTTSEITSSAGVLLSWITRKHQRSYWSHLPSLNFTWHMGRNNRIRINGAKLIARPRLQDLGRGLTVDSWENISTAQLSIEPEDWNGFNSAVRGGEQGNNTLKPYKVSQVDVSHEYYWGDANYVIAGIFYKDIKSLIYTRTKLHFGEGYSMGGANITQPENQSGGRVVGLELAFQKLWGNGFGLHLNYTLSDSKTQLSSFNKDVLSLPGFSDSVFNFIGIFENTHWSIRVGYSWRSEFLSPQNSLRDIYYTPDGLGAERQVLSFADYHNSVGRWDARIKRYVTQKLSISLDLNNITESAQTHYLEFANNPLSYSSTEPRAQLSVRYTY